MEDRALWMVLVMLSGFFGAMMGGFFAGIVLGSVYYIWLRKKEEDRLWDLGKHALMEGMGYATSFMKSVVAEIPEEDKNAISEYKTPPGSSLKPRKPERKQIGQAITSEEEEYGSTMES